METDRRPDQESERSTSQSAQGDHIAQARGAGAPAFTDLELRIRPLTGGAYPVELSVHGSTSSLRIDE